MKKENDLDIVCRLGLAPIYARAEVLKRKLAHDYCLGILNKIDNWESAWNDAKRCFDRSAFYGRWIVDADLSEFQRIVFFWKILADEIQKGSKAFYEGFPEKYHSYSEENFNKLCDWLESQRWSTRNIDIIKDSIINIDALNNLNDE